MASQSPASSCTIEQQRIGAIEVLSVVGVVDMITAPQLEEAIAAAAEESPQGVIVDLDQFMSAVRQIDEFFVQVVRLPQF